MARTRRLSTTLLVAGCIASLAGVRPVRLIEQLPAPLLAPGDGLLARFAAGPDPERAELLELLREPARAAFAAWGTAVLGEVPVAGGGREGLLVPVTEQRPDRHEFVLAVPAGAVVPGTVVTHRGALVGFVASLEARGTRAVVARLGHAESRPVAAQWWPAPEARPVQFLATSGGAGDGYALGVQARSSTLLPAPRQPAFTRDVAALGDDLPPGLLLGALVGGKGEAPGGGTYFALGEGLVVEPLVDVARIELATVEVPPGAQPVWRRVRARLSSSCRAPSAARIDAGLRRDIVRGDVVAQAGLYVGRVASVSLFDAVLDTSVPSGELLFVAPDGSAVACTPARDSWPSGWEPRRGDLVATGDLATGGLVVGTVLDVDAAGLSIKRLPPDPDGAVQVTGP